jgi:hypothetical protein
MRIHHPIYQSENALVVGSSSISSQTNDIILTKNDGGSFSGVDGFTPPLPKHSSGKQSQTATPMNNPGQSGRGRENSNPGSRATNDSCPANSTPALKSCPKIVHGLNFNSAPKTKEKKGNGNFRNRSKNKKSSIKSELKKNGKRLF